LSGKLLIINFFQLLNFAFLRRIRGVELSTFLLLESLGFDFSPEKIGSDVIVLVLPSCKLIWVIGSSFCVTKFLPVHRLDRRHPEDVFQVFWPHMARTFSRCYGHLEDGEEVNVFTEVIPHAGRRIRVPTRVIRAPTSPPSGSLLERRSICRPDLDLGALRYMRERLTLAIPSRQVIHPLGIFLFCL
jgi:hypothetical protein